MDFKVIFHKSFLDDFEQIVTRIVALDPTAAFTFGNLVVRTCESLSFFPERHPTVRQRPGIRRLVVHKYYKVFYRVRRGAKTVEILRFWDGRRGIEPRTEG